MKKMLDSLQLDIYNCDFVDIRIEDSNNTDIDFKNGEIQNAFTLPNIGAFIRVKIGKMWYYSSLTDLSKLDDTICSLIRLSGRNDLYKTSSHLEYNFQEFNNISEDMLIFKDIETKISFLKSANQVLMKETEIVTYNTRYKDYYLKKLYKNSKGVFYYYDKSLVSMVSGYMFKRGEQRYNSYYAQSGHYLKDFVNFSDNLYQDLQEAKLFIDAPTIEPGKYPVILSEETTGVFAHESFGHKSEADFMIGDEEMKKEWEIGKKVANPMVSIVDDGSTQLISGYVPIDDEGNKKEKVYLIKNGILSGRLHSKDTADQLNEQNTGNARAVNFFFEPIVRMTNTYIEPGNDTFESLCAGIKDGFYIKKITHGSGLSTFTLAVNRAWRIRNGKLAEPVKVKLITGSVFQTLNDIDGLSNQIKIDSSAIGGCGKMEQSPLQVSHGGPKIRVKEMMVS